MLIPVFSALVAFAGVGDRVDAAADAVADAVGNVVNVDDADIDAAAAAARDGDVILQTSTSSQAPAILAATASLYSHTGVVVVEGVGGGRRVFVVEASNVVKKTPFREFAKRGLGGRFVVLRRAGLTAAQAATVAKMAKRQLGKPYDATFSPGRGALYCSELVAVAYADAGLQVGVWENVGDLHTENPLVDALLAKRWRKHPACKGAAALDDCRARIAETPLITPQGLRDDEGFVVVADTYSG